MPATPVAPQSAQQGRRMSPYRPELRSRRLATSQSHPSPTPPPPTPMIGRSGNAAWTSWTARTATGWIARPESPPPPGAKHGTKRVRIVTQPEQGVDTGNGFGAGVPDRSCHFDNPVGVCAQLRPSRPPARRRRGDYLGGHLDVMGENRATTLKVGARQVDLDGHDCGRGSCQHLGRVSVISERAAPDRGHDSRAGGQQTGQDLCHPVLDPGALQVRRHSSCPVASDGLAGAGFPGHSYGASDFVTTAPS